MKPIVILIAISLSFPALLFANYTVELRNPLSVSTIGGLVGLIINFLKYFAYAIAPIAIVVAGYYFLTSAGDPNKVATARNIVLWTLAGVLIIAASDVLIQIISGILN